jgi:hypothetical protein
MALLYACLVGEPNHNIILYSSDNYYESVGEFAEFIEKTENTNKEYSEILRQVIKDKSVRNLTPLST